MSLRRDTVTRVNEARKSSLPTIGRGKPLNARGFEGDLTFRRTPDGLKLYIKANHQWHGVKVGESFDGLEKVIKDIKSKVDTIKQFRLPSTYSVTGDFTLDVSGDISLDADGGEIYLKDGGTTFGEFSTATSKSRFLLYEAAGASDDDYFRIIVGSHGEATLTTVDAAAENAELSLIADGDIILDSATGKFVAKQAGAEFSVANSAYAGMILGYTMIGESAVHSSYTLTTSYVVPDDALTVRFEAPPSGAVEVTVQVFHDGGAGRTNYFGLSSQSATDGYASIGNSYEHVTSYADETDAYVLQHSWVVTGLTAGNTYNYWLGAKTSGGTGYIRWGGTATGRYGDFIMKVVALPTAVANYAVYN